MKKLFIIPLLLLSLFSCKKDVILKEEGNTITVTVLVNCDECAVNLWYGDSMFYSYVYGSKNIPIVLNRGDVLKTSLYLGGIDDASRSNRLIIAVVYAKGVYFGKADSGLGFSNHLMFNNDFKIK